MLPKLNAALGTWLRLDALDDLICDLKGLVLTGSAICPRVVSSGHKYLDWHDLTVKWLSKAHCLAQCDIIVFYFVDSRSVTTPGTVTSSCQWFTALLDSM